jgi:hypothetical protein
MGQITQFQELLKTTIAILKSFVEGGWARKCLVRMRFPRFNISSFFGVAHDLHVLHAQLSAALGDHRVDFFCPVATVMQRFMHRLIPLYVECAKLCSPVIDKIVARVNKRRARTKAVMILTTG